MKDINYYEKTNSANQVAYLKLQCSCVLCNSKLELKFENLGDGIIKEVAHCLECEIRTRAKIYLLQ